MQHNGPYGMWCWTSSSFSRWCHRGRLSSSQAHCSGIDRPDTQRRSRVAAAHSFWVLGTVLLAITVAHFHFFVGTVGDHSSRSSLYGVRTSVIQGQLLQAEEELLAVKSILEEELYTMGLPVFRIGVASIALLNGSGISLRVLDVRLALLMIDLTTSSR